LIGQDPSPSPAIKPAVSNKVAKGDIIDLLGDLDLSPPSIQPGKCLHSYVIFAIAETYIITGIKCYCYVLQKKRKKDK